MRCPYCRLVMPDESTRCLRCSAVKDDGRWVRGRAPGRTAPPTAASSPAGDAPRRDAARPVANEPGDQAEPAPVGRGGCLAIAAAGAVLAVILVVVGLALAAPDEPERPRWGEGYAAAFTASCVREGRAVDTCRCLRTALEQRFTEDELRDLSDKLAKGRLVGADEENELRAAERRCA